jgi:TPR repeat protein
MGIYDCARQSLKWWLMAAEQGHAPSQFKYAQTYYRELKGTSISGRTSPLFSEEERPKYMGLALKWSRKAAEQGNADAQYLLGMIYDDGDALGQRQIEDAFVWWSLSAAGGNTWAKEKVEPLELQLDSAVMSKARARIASLKAEIESKKTGK